MPDLTKKSWNFRKSVKMIITGWSTGIALGGKKTMEISCVWKNYRKEIQPLVFQCMRMSKIKSRKEDHLSILQELFLISLILCNCEDKKTLLFRLHDENTLHFLKNTETLSIIFSSLHVEPKNCNFVSFLNSQKSSLLAGRYYNILSVIVGMCFGSSTCSS